jgi:hypothetical protein
MLILKKWTTMKTAKKMAVSVVLIALLEKYSVYLCAVIAHQGHRRVKNSKEYIWNV